MITDDCNVKDGMAPCRDCEKDEERAYLLAEMTRRAAELDATLDAMADGLIVYDTAGRILRMNKAAEEMHGLSPEEWQLPVSERVALLGTTTADGCPLDLATAPGTRALRGETVRDFLLILHLRDGTRRYLSNSSAPIYLPDGRLVGAISTLSDVTPLYTLQQEREVFLHTISHDLRNPLSIVSGNAQLLDATLAPDDPAREFMDGILHGTHRMQALLQDLAELARVGGDGIVLNRQPVALATFLAPLLRHAGVALDIARVRVEAPPDLPPVHADPDRLERIVLNLVSNGLRYSPEGTAVTVRARAEDDAVELSVADQGRGIDPEDVPHIFEQYYRTKQSRAAQGIGLGLYITHKLVTAHGGQIWVESEVGRGSTFFVRLPVWGRD